MVLHFLFSATIPCISAGTLQLSPLVSYSNDTVGRLEICYDGYWGSVCDDYADDVVADVACRQLGHSGGQIFLTIMIMHINYVEVIKFMHAMV